METQLVIDNRSHVAFLSMDKINPKFCWRNSQRVCTNECTAFNITSNLHSEAEMANVELACFPKTFDKINIVRLK